MPEFPLNHYSSDVESVSFDTPPLQPSSTQSILRKPWLHLIIFAIINSIFLTVMLAIVGVILVSSLGLLVMATALSAVSIFGVNFSFIDLLLTMVEIVLATFVFFFIHRKRKVVIPKITVIIVIGIFAFSGLIIPHYVARTQEKASNPVQMGVKQFNFSDDTIINDRKSAKHTLAVSDNAVIWVEHTKQAPPYSDNVWDLFLFTFDKDSGQGEMIQLTDTDKAVHKTPDTAIIDGDTVYWTVDAKLYKYTISTRNQEVIREKTTGIYGINGDIALVSGLDEGEHGGVSIFGAPIKGYHLVDLSTKTVVRDVTQYEDSSWFTGTVGSDAYCSYDHLTGIASIVSLEVEPKVAEARLPYPTESSNEMVACGTGSVVFTSYQGGLRIYDVKTTKTTTIDSSVTTARGKLIDGILYYVGNFKLKKYNPQTGEAKEIATLPLDSWNDHQRYWDMSQEYTVYLEHTSEYDSNVHLRRLPGAEQ